jgi:hypothetical protein
VQGENTLARHLHRTNQLNISILIKNIDVTKFGMTHESFKK